MRRAAHRLRQVISPEKKWLSCSNIWSPPVKKLCKSFRTALGSLRVSAKIVALVEARTIDVLRKHVRRGQHKTNLYWSIHFGTAGPGTAPFAWMPIAASLVLQRWHTIRRIFVERFFVIALLSAAVAILASVTSFGSLTCVWIDWHQ